MSLQNIDIVQVTQTSQAEQQWASNIKAAVEANDEIHNVSDMDYVHHALIAKEDVEGALRRIQGLQYFREEYNINDTVEEGMQLIQAFMKQQDRFLLTVDVDLEKGHFVWVYDNAKIYPGRVDFPEDWRTYLGGLYYLFQAMHSNIHACREGVVHVAENEGISRENFDMNRMRRVFSDLCEHYPFGHKEISWIRTPLTANLLYSFIKKLMRPDNSYTFQTGCTFHGYTDRLDGIFHIPNVQVAEQFLLLRLQEYLKTRYFMEKNYRLPTTALAPAMEEDNNMDEDGEDA